MQRQSESIAALAAALARAQIELENPEKSLIGSIEAKDKNAPERLFRYASLASGLEIVRKTLGQHDIATVQTTAVDQSSSIVNLTTVLAHASGEWIASDWPVCPISETAAPHRMGAALTYARRYALFTLVGIAGEDDLDAPDLLAPKPQHPQPRTGHGNRDEAGPLKNHPRTAGPTAASRRNGKGPAVSVPILEPEASAQLRDQLIVAIGKLDTSEGAALWAHRCMKDKNRLTTNDATCVEECFASKLAAFALPEHVMAPAEGMTGQPASEGEKPRSRNKRRLAGINKTALALPELRRIRDREHVRHVANQSCLICGRRPCDAHHLRFTQSRALGRKVSDEFTVPLCRGHHRELHRHGDEFVWWQKVAVEPVVAARALWLETHPQLATDAKTVRPATERGAGKGRRRNGRPAKSTARTQRRTPKLRNEANLGR
jgi:hypothetical protein